MKFGDPDGDYKWAATFLLPLIGGTIAALYFLAWAIPKLRGMGWIE